MSPIFKCLICRKDIERSTKTFWIKKGHLLCSTCLDNIEKKTWVIRFKKFKIVIFKLGKAIAIHPNKSQIIITFINPTMASDPLDFWAVNQ